WLLVVLLLSWGGAVLFRRWQPAGAGGRVLERVLRFAILIGWVLTTLLSLSISPAAYSGRHPVQALGDFWGDIVAGAGHAGNALGLALLTAYLWWRGLLLGRERLTRERLYMRFVGGLVVIILAIAVAASVTAPARAPLTGLLAILLPA